MKQISYHTMGWICAIMLMGFMTPAVNAQDYTLDVGETAYVKQPKLASNLYFEEFSGLGTDNEYIEVINKTTFRVKRYFTGTIMIYCYYTYYFYVQHYNPVTHTYTDIKRGANGSVSYSVQCRGSGNDITLTTPKTTISCGETVQLSYSFAQPYSVTPEISYSSSSDCVTVSSTGLVKAVSPGSAKISARSNLGANESSVSITVKEETPTGVVITPNETTIYLDESQKLGFEVLPYGTLQKVSWSIEPGKEDLMSVGADGVVTGIAVGQGKVIAKTKNGIQGTCQVTLIEPQVRQTNTYPEDNATGISVFDAPAITYSHTIVQGDKFSDITLMCDDGTAVAGIASIDGCTLIFKPEKALNALTRYTLTVPASALKNKWGSDITAAASVSFRTRQFEKLTLTASPIETYYNVGDPIELKCDNPKAAIHYTTDGSIPTVKSPQYSRPLEISQNFTLKAIAKMDGYEDSDLLEATYHISNVGVVSRFPNIEQMSTYRDVIPNVRFSNRIRASKNIEDITLKDTYGFEMRYEVIVADSSVYVIPSEELRTGQRYTVIIPADAVVTVDGESNYVYEWTFSTGDYATAISMGGHELGASIKMDSGLMTWGNIYVDGDVADGSVVFNQSPTPQTFISNGVTKVSSGYTHHAVIKADGSLWMWGRQYCGEFGNNSTKGSATPVKVMNNVLDVSAGGQTTAILTEDNTLWMCGRNDFGQIGNGTTDVCRKPVKVLEHVRMAVAGWCSTYAIDTDNTLWAWGLNDRHQLGDGTDSTRLVPSPIIQNVSYVATCANESPLAAAIKTDATLWVWGGDNVMPTQIDSDVYRVSIGCDYVAYIKNDGTLYAYGGNAYGQLGTDNTAEQTDPARIMDHVDDIISGGQTTMALRDDGSVWTWGRNYAGALGQADHVASATDFAKTPEQIIDGLTYSDLQGAYCRKNLSIVSGSYGVIELFPIPLNAKYKSITWHSDNPVIAEVDERGVVEANLRGETDITCTIIDESDRQVSTICHVFVGNVDEVEGIEDVLADGALGFKVWSDNRTIHITNIPPGQTVRIFNTSGIMLYEDISDGTELQIPVSMAGVYLVYVNQFISKVICR